jgi:hypothetical protein
MSAVKSTEGLGERKKREFRIEDSDVADQAESPPGPSTPAPVASAQHNSFPTVPTQTLTLPAVSSPNGGIATSSVAGHLPNPTPMQPVPAPVPATPLVHIPTAAIPASAPAGSAMAPVPVGLNRTGSSFAMAASAGTSVTTASAGTSLPLAVTATSAAAPAVQLQAAAASAPPSTLPSAMALQTGSLKAGAVAPLLSSAAGVVVAGAAGAAALPPKLVSTVPNVGTPALASAGSGTNPSKYPLV